ncbi:TPA: hypothetical protein N0F65_008805 [Lagenidium giganteum]|uniref:Temptin Cys/Cys disulfide domain-containing protein n=1 Tax=Lagenidium giganteum TaxID=4803 RepID=A0AAV2YZ05_9STRA|nr:TPA: hypothetical protein N0F65_008805 [Lagenidium giganteum]
MSPPSQANKAKATTTFRDSTNMAMPLARAAVVTLGLTPAVLVQAYPQYLMQIPNGLNFGMGISHEPGTRKLTSFGRMWSSWHNWAVVCEREFPDAMGITTGAALGDPCCTWVPGGIPDYVLQAVSLEGTVQSVSQVAMVIVRVSIALLAASLMLRDQPVEAFPGYLDQIPNGDNFGMMIAHVHTRKLTKFGMLWFNAHRWSKICHETFPGTNLTCGQALGDPCCTWKPGTKPDYILEEVSVDGTVCHNATSVLDLGMKEEDPTTAPPSAPASSPEATPNLRQHTATDAPTSTPPHAQAATANEKRSTSEKPAWHPEQWHPNVTRGFC